MWRLRIEIAKYGIGSLKLKVKRNIEKPSEENYKGMR